MAGKYAQGSSSSEADAGTFLNMLNSSIRSGNQDMERASYESMANTLTPSLMEYLNNIPQRVRQANVSNEDRQNRSEQAEYLKAGLTRDPNLSGGLVPRGGGGGAPRQFGGGISPASSIPARSGGKDYWTQDQEFQRSLNQDRVRQSQQNSLDLNKSQQEQDIKLKMLMKLMSSMGGSGGGGRGGDGYTEQIFNNAGAPQVVRLQNRQPGQQSQMLAQLLSGLR